MWLRQYFYLLLTLLTSEVLWTPEIETQEEEMRDTSYK
jgi:hypothetical protein